MLTFIELLFLCSAWIWGINFIFRSNQVFGGIGDYIRMHLPENIVKPLIGCPPCMSSYHGALFYLFFFDFSHALYIPVFCIALCGINLIIRDLIYEAD